MLLRIVSWLRQRGGRRTLRLAAIAMLLLPCGAPHAAADRLIEFEREGLTKLEWLLLEPEFTYVDDWGDSWARDIVPQDRLSGDEKQRLATAVDIIRNHMLLYARFDADGDGEDDLLVWLTDTYNCGFVGCTAFLFQRYGGWWRRVGYANADSFSGVCLTDVVSHGRPVLLFRRIALAWDGTDYIEMCLAQCPPDSDPMTREKLPSTALLRQHVFCPPSPNGSGR